MKNRNNIQRLKEASDFLVDTFNSITLREVMENGNVILDETRKIENLLSEFKKTIITKAKVTEKVSIEKPHRKLKGAKLRIVNFLGKNGASYGSKIAKKLKLANPYMDFRELENFGILERTFENGNSRTLWKVK